MIDRQKVFTNVDGPKKLPEICLEGGAVWFINDMAPPYEQNWGSFLLLVTGTMAYSSSGIEAISIKIALSKGHRRDDASGEPVRVSQIKADELCFIACLK